MLPRKHALARLPQLEGLQRCSHLTKENGMHPFATPAADAAELESLVRINPDQADLLQSGRPFSHADRSFRHRTSGCHRYGASTPSLLKLLFSISAARCHSSVKTTTKSSVRRRKKKGFRAIFQGVDDSRESNATKHDLIEMLATPSGWSSCRSFARYAKYKYEFLSGFMKFKGGPANRPECHSPYGRKAVGPTAFPVGGANAGISTHVHRQRREARRETLKCNCADRFHALQYADAAVKAVPPV